MASGRAGGPRLIRGVIGRGLGAGLAPTLSRDGAWRALLGGAVAYLAWQATVAVAAAIAYVDRGRGGPCHVGPLCRLIADWSDARVGIVALFTLSLSIVVFLVLGRITLALLRRRFWAGFATRIAGWATVVGSILLILLGGLPWLLLGGWLVYWSGRLRYEPPDWAAAGQTAGAPPPDPLVIEGERVATA